MKRPYAMYEVTIEDEWVTIRLPRWEAAALSRLVNDTAAQHCTSRDERYRMRGIAQLIRKRLFPPPAPRYVKRGTVERPPSAFHNAIDVDYVVSSSCAPFPVLSETDMRIAYQLLEAKKLTSREIAARLYTTQRTVHRWRRITAEKEKRDGTKHEAGDC